MRVPFIVGTAFGEKGEVFDRGPDWPAGTSGEDAEHWLAGGEAGKRVTDQRRDVVRQ